jgi:hypothetical protein
MWKDILFEILHWGSLLFAALCMRWLMQLSTPAQDYQAAGYVVRDIWQHMQVPDWRDSFNMERLRWLRERIRWERASGGAYERDNPSTVIVNGTIATATGTVPTPAPDIDANRPSPDESRA